MDEVHDLLLAKLQVADLVFERLDQALELNVLLHQHVQVVKHAIFLLLQLRQFSVLLGLLT